MEREYLVRHRGAVVAAYAASAPAVAHAKRLGTAADGYPLGSVSREVTSGTYRSVTPVWPHAGATYAAHEH